MRNKERWTEVMVTIDGWGEVFSAYTQGDRWNGWATPFFTFGEAQKLMESMRKRDESPSRKSEGIFCYDENADAFFTMGTDEETWDEWEGVETPYGTLYAIGSWAWIWDEVDMLDRAERLSEVATRKPEGHCPFCGKLHTMDLVRSGYDADTCLHFLGARDGRVKDPLGQDSGLFFFWFGDND